MVGGLEEGTDTLDPISIDRIIPVVMEDACTSSLTTGITTHLLLPIVMQQFFNMADADDALDQADVGGVGMEVQVCGGHANVAACLTGA